MSAYVLPLLGVMLCAAGLYMLQAGRRDLHRLRRLSSTGRQAIATVMAMRADDSGEDTEHYLTLRFRPPGHDAVTAEKWVPPQVHSGTGMGQCLWVRYDPQRPADFELIADRLGRAAPHVTLAFALLFLIAGLGLLILSLPGIVLLLLGFMT